MNKQRIKVICLLISITLALIIATLMVYVALDHNPQGEFCAYTTDMSSCEYQYGAITSVFFGWLFASLFIFGILAVLLCLIGRCIVFFSQLIQR
ncbi:hypothetical protein HPTD01_232 [Halomonas sp. TD01]|nr:hypothetical protein GME_05590 [Halomonas sp. TD01]CAH1041754.1 hypothetical protein HPTD01_232 [Halomonas sp. TD01]